MIFLEYLLTRLDLHGTLKEWTQKTIASVHIMLTWEQVLLELVYREVGKNQTQFTTPLIYRMKTLTECWIGWPLPTGFPVWVSNKWITEKKERKNSNNNAMKLYSQTNLILGSFTRYFTMPCSIIIDYSMARKSWSKSKQSDWFVLVHILPYVLFPRKKS